MLKRFVCYIKNPRVSTTAGILIGSFLLAFLLALLLPNTFAGWNNQVIDRFIRLRYRLIGKQEVSPYLIHIVVNDTSHQVLELPSWDRNVFGQVIDILQDTNVKLIACDVFFKDTSFPENDRLLLAATKKSRKVIFPILVYPEGYFTFQNLDVSAVEYKDLVEAHILYPKVEQGGEPPVGKYVIPPFRELSSQVLGLGHINYSPDSDGMCRRIHLLYRYKNGYIPAFSLKMALEYFGVTEENIEVDFGKHIILRDARIRDDFTKDVVIPIDRQGRIIVNFVAPWENSFLNFPVHNLLATENDADARSHLFDLMDEALVVISDISTTNRDYGPGIFENVYPLSGIHVNIVNSILTESFLTDQSLPQAMLVALFFAVLLWGFAVRVRGVSFSLFCVLLYALFVGASIWQFISLHTVPRIFAPSLGFLFSLVAINVYRIFVVEQEKSVYKVKSEAGRKLEAVNRELVQQKRDLEIANRKLGEMDRFKTIFVQNIAHEFRTPITLIIEPLESIWNHGNERLSDFVIKNLTFVRKNAHKLLHLVNQFLEMSKFEAGKVQLEVRRSDIVDFLRTFLMRFEPIAESKHVQLRLSSTEDSIYSYFDPDKLDKIFTNLLSNSLKSTEINDLVEIIVTPPINGKKPLKKAKPGVIPLEEMIEIRVRDTGSGIPEKELPFIFKRFHQVDHPATKAGGGSGVGLSLVKECIDIHHGHIIVESKMGKGTQFTLFLPWAREHFLPEEIAEEQDLSELDDPNSEDSRMNAPSFNVPGDITPTDNRTTNTLAGRGDGRSNPPSVGVSKQFEATRRIEGKFPEEPILIVDDEIDLLENYKIQLTENGIDNLILCSEGTEVLPILRKQEISSVLLDLSLPGVSGRKILAGIKENYPNIHVLVLTGLQDVEAAVDCIKLGAFDYMVKPVELSRLLSNINHCIEKSNLEKEINVLSHKIQSMELKNREAFSEIVTNNESMLSKFRYVEAIAESSNPVLISGESGVGKELIANVIHRLSNRQGKFVSENIAGLDDTMITDTLFGHAKGAFTDAEGVRKGLVEEATGGTLFLDEIGDMSINSQVKLLRFIEEKEYRPLGTDKVKLSDARVIIATNANLKEKLEAGTFRKDLFYRLTYQIHIPPLRDRLDDLPYLVDHFVEQTAEALGHKKPTVPQELILLLRTYDFPGNVRELKNMIENALSRSASKNLSLSYFKEYLQSSSYKRVDSDVEVDFPGNSITLPGKFPKLKEIEDYIVAEALKRSKGNQNIAARLLGLSPSALSRRIKKKGGKQRW